MPRMGFAIEDQRSSSTFRFEEGRGSIVSAVVRKGSTGFNEDKCLLVVGIQRLGRDGKPTEDDVVEEELTIGKLSKFHPGNANGPSDEDPEDLGTDGEGNAICAIEGAHPDPKAKASSFGKSLQEAGLRPALLNGYLPNLIGIDANWAREMVKYGAGMNDGSNLIVKKGEGNILNLSDINKRANGASAPAKTTAKPAAGKKAAPAAEPEAEPEPENESAPDGPTEAETTLIGILAKMPGKTATTIARGKISSKVVAMMAGKVPPAQHKPIQQLAANKAWLNETAENLGWTVEGDTFTIPAAE